MVRSKSKYFIPILCTSFSLLSSSACMSFDDEEEELFVEEAVIEDSASEEISEEAEFPMEDSNFSVVEESVDSFDETEPVESIIADYSEPMATEPIAAPTSLQTTAPTSFETALPPAGTQSVYYVKTDIDLVDSPGGGSIIGKAYQGDPVLVSTQGEWAQISGKGWIKMSQLSSQIVSRSKTASSWTTN